MDNFLHEVLLLSIMACAVAAASLRKVVYSLIAVSAMSLLLSLEFYLLQAPDVAIAEAGIGAGLTITIYVLAMRACRDKRGDLP